MRLSEKEGKELIKLARESIKSVFSNSLLKIDDNIKSRFDKKQGVFVTLSIKGELRGCIGYPEPVFQLYKAVVNAAKSAAFSDPRFNPLDKEDFKQVDIELSVLTVPELIKVRDAKDYLNSIKVGEDGLIIRSELSSGLLLPQVFTEYKCDIVKALEMTCKKAMLNKDEWKNLDNKIYKFQAQIFKE